MSFSFGGEVNFLSKLLQGISFLPSIVSAVEGLFASKSGTQKKDAAPGRPTQREWGF
jgi:hypothetical protein